MISDQIREAEDAARFLTRVLAGFSESSMYEAYKSIEDFTDEEYERAIETLTDFGNGIRIERERPRHTPWPYTVGLNLDGKPGDPAGAQLRRFKTEDEAAAFISTLDGHLDGRYYLDGPEEVST